MAHLLVIDDDETERAHMVEVLRGAGHTVVETWSAMQGVSRTTTEQFDAVVLDLMLPDAHGTEVALALRAIHGTQQTPIVAVTRRLPEPGALEPASFSVECVLQKPVPPEALLSAVGRCLGTAIT
jgi:CheY-like chemotaxis protein